VRGRGRPKMTWNQVVEKDIRLRDCGLSKVDAQDQIKWRRLVWEPTGQPPLKKGKSIVVVCAKFLASLSNTRKLHTGL